MVKTLLVNVGNAGDAGLIPGLGRSPGEGNGNPLQYFAWKIPWTEESGGLHYIPWDHTELDTTECAWTHTHTHTHTHTMCPVRERDTYTHDVPYERERDIHTQCAL